ncbi:hypothetical protein FOL47_001164 [Perkinsus chesapeaki]|uniref:Dehydrogenase/reductase SDR member 12 n=1 Tax=Perkinsus chesapeaki TaxID=330153 RepID=A0A7J6MJU6_PERCH|nr:hypothetical protein FOL47_001164 [Perkinsus chesapeaki]
MAALLRTIGAAVAALAAIFFGVCFTFDMEASRGYLPILWRAVLNSCRSCNRAHVEDYTQYDIPSNLSDKVILITGASSGIGYQSAKLLSSRGAKVILGIRGTRQRLDNITQSIPGQVLAPAPLNLSDYSSIRDFVKALPTADINHLDILILNAGKRAMTFTTNSDGVEWMLAAHHLGHAYLFELLTPLALRAPGEVRVVLTASVAHMWPYPEGVRYKDTEEGFKSNNAYGTSKLANILYGRELAKRMEKAHPHKFVVASANPGAVHTEFSDMVRNFPNWVAYNASVGAMPVLRAAVDANVTTDG